MKRTREDIDRMWAAYEDTLSRHESAYREWAHTHKFSDAIKRDDRRRELKLFGLTPSEIGELEAAIDAKYAFSGS